MKHLQESAAKVLAEMFIDRARECGITFHSVDGTLRFQWKWDYAHLTEELSKTYLQLVNKDEVDS